MCGWKRWRRWGVFAHLASPICCSIASDRSESGDPCGGAEMPQPRSIPNSSWRFYPGWIPTRSGACGRRSRRCSGRCRRDIALPGLTSMLGDDDQPRDAGGARQRSSSFGRPTLTDVLLQHLKAEDRGVRAAAANGLGEIKPADGAAGAGRGVSVRPAGLARIRRAPRRSPRSRSTERPPRRRC